MTIIEEGWVREVRHVSRERNRCADFLANLVNSNQLGTSVFWEPPAGLAWLVEQDIDGPPIVRS
ncbi:hypothetical protein CCACVL1_25632 [Corchorus capsularis]|uniref:RNase H type-1 domain-containing protein n=1 Tax=Corchorus capsularis TaxID=210143 RepID=A0A1R3GIS3_COCAP|nr:hypothetical protein CCACVL1_25632 [Corchorus capsularis]